MDGEDAEDCILDRPFGSVVMEDELIVLQKFRQGVVIHQLLALAFALTTAACRRRPLLLLLLPLLLHELRHWA